jgi:hypothetical protein
MVDRPEGFAVGGTQPTLLKVLLSERHLQSYAAFCREYRQVAQHVNTAPGHGPPSEEQYRRWLRGSVGTPRPDCCRVLERMFPGHGMGDLLAPYAAREQSSPAPVASEDTSGLNKREFLQVGGAAVMTALFNQLWSEPGLMHIALDDGTVSPTRVGDLQAEAARLGVAAVRVSPASLLEEATARFRETRELAMAKQPLGVHRELVRCGAMFGTVLGELLFVLGQFPMARQWYAVARRSALEADDQYLADIALAGMTYLPTYSSDPRGVLDLVDARLDAAGTSSASSPALAWLWGFKAKAHARLGNAYAFDRSIDRARQAFERSTPERIHPGIFSFEAPKLAFYEACANVDLGRTQQASDAALRAIALYDFSETTEPSLVRLDQASAFVQMGEVGEGCRIATMSITDPRTFPARTVLTRAHQFDASLGSSTCEPVREWREVLASLRLPKAAVALSAFGDE